MLTKRYISLPLKMTCVFTFIFYTIRKFSESTLIFDQLLISGFLTIIAMIPQCKHEIQNGILKYISRLLAITLILILASFQMVGNIDRSRSFYLISWINEGKVIYSGESLKLSVSSNEAKNIEAISQRLKEQLDRKLITFDTTGKFTLTPYGRFTLVYSNFFAKVFNLKGWVQNKS